MYIYMRTKKNRTGRSKLKFNNGDKSPKELMNNNNDRMIRGTDEWSEENEEE